MTQDTTADPVLAEGVGRRNRLKAIGRLFKGYALIFITAFATLYAAFHMAALNGLSISSVLSMPQAMQADRAETQERRGVSDPP